MWTMVSKSAWRVIACLMLLCGNGCRLETSDSLDVQIEMTMIPSVPTVGSSDVTLRLTNTEGSPLRGAALQLEGNMNHAGMKPTFGELEEVDPGIYSGTLEFTMGGDWFILVTGHMPDGGTIARTLNVPGVKSRR